MITINNIQPLSPEALFDLLKTDFPAYVNEQLGSNLTVDFAHVFDIINITDHTTEGTYNTELLEQHLTGFLTLKAG